MAQEGINSKLSVYWDNPTIFKVNLPAVVHTKGLTQVLYPPVKISCQFLTPLLTAGVAGAVRMLVRYRATGSRGRRLSIFEWMSQVSISFKAAEGNRSFPLWMSHNGIHWFVPQVSSACACVRACVRACVYVCFVLHTYVCIAYGHTVKPIHSYMNYF